MQATKNWNVNLFVTEWSTGRRARATAEHRRSFVWLARWQGIIFMWIWIKKILKRRRRRRQQQRAVKYPPIEILAAVNYSILLRFDYPQTHFQHQLFISSWKFVKFELKLTHIGQIWVEIDHFWLKTGQIWVEINKFGSIVLKLTMFGWKLVKFGLKLTIFCLKLTN